MKTILLIAAMMGATLGSYAQNKECACKKTHRATAYHKTVMRKNTSCQSTAGTNSTWTREYVLTAKEEPCFQYRQHNIVVTECPGTFYDNSDLRDMGNSYETEGSYMGNYPVQSNGVERLDEAPQGTTIDPGNGVAPQGGNGFYNCKLK